MRTAFAYWGSCTTVGATCIIAPHPPSRLWIHISFLQGPVSRAKATHGVLAIIPSVSALDGALEGTGIAIDVQAAGNVSESHRYRGESGG